MYQANIPGPGLSTPAVTFNTNITMNFNLFQAAALRLDRVVWASSETTLGLPFDVPPELSRPPPKLSRAPGLHHHGRRHRHEPPLG